MLILFGRKSSNSCRILRCPKLGLDIAFPSFCPSETPFASPHMIAGSSEEGRGLTQVF
jgi:hypothetical protein